MIIREGMAMRIVFFYPGEEGTHVDNARVVLHASGIVEITSAQEDTTTHVQNCEIMWKFEVDSTDQTGTEVANVTSIRKKIR